MKHMVKRLISFIALMAMLVSMISVCVFPAAADADDAKYEALLGSAKIVNAAWANTAQGTQISYDYRGRTVNEAFNPTRHFATYADAWEQIEKEKWTTTPTVLLCAGTYDKKIELFGSVNLIGPNAGIDAVDAASKTAGEDQAWAKNANRSPEAIIASNLIIRMAAKGADFTFDGLAFVAGGAVIDAQRGNTETPYDSDMVFKNSVFENAGNSALAKGNTINLESAGVKRIIHMENLYIANQNLVASSGNLTAGFISPYYAELYADNIAYVDSKSGFLALSFAEASIIPVIEVTNSCFHNATSSASGFVISMDNMTYSKKVNGSSLEEVPVAVSSIRPGASLKLHNNVFYNASSGSKGVIHFELLNKNTVVDMQNNYFFSEVATSPLELEFGVDSSGVDQSSCFVIRNNRFVGTYMIPSLAGSNASTYIDMSNNYFGDVNGNTVYVPVYVDPDFPRLIRTSYWIDEAMTVASTPWNMSINDWPLASVDNTHYVGELSLYNEDASGLFAANFSAQGANTKVTLYKAGTVVSDGILSVQEKDRIDRITDSMLPDSAIKIYAKVENSDYPGFAPIFEIEVQKIGSLVNMPDFSQAFDSDTLMYHPILGDAAVGSVLPMKWNGVVYKMTVGKNLFGSDEKLFSFAKNNNIAIPTILLPAGAYSEELNLYGSCTVLGETNGVNPNKKPYEVIGENDLLSSAWSLNEAWANTANVTTFNAPVRVNAAADDFIITIDGIKFGPGGGIVEDVHREKSNTLIIKNIYMDNAGGFTNKAGASSNYLFDFSKTIGVSKDLLSVYVSDARITNTGNLHIFGPYVEKLVVDGVYMGSIYKSRQFFDDISSRNTSDPYVALTNSYFDRSAYGLDSFTMFGIDNTTGDQTIKTNIVYNIDNNVFFDAFPSGDPMIDVKFTGTNMRYYFTNNIVYDAANNGEVMAGAGNFVGDCAENDVSDMIVFKGNRLIRWRRLPLTTGTAIGTQFDFSGNYFSDGIGQGGLDHIAANIDSKAGAEPTTPASTLESIRRRRIDYTFLDWDMTVRSDAVLNDASYTFNKGMFGNGTYGYEMLNGTKQMVYRENNVPADCAVYELPFTVSENATAKIYTSSAYTEDSLVEELRLSAVESRFYVRVTSADGTAIEEFAIIIGRKMNTECALVRFDNFFVNEAEKTVTGHLDRRYIFIKTVVEVSNGATFEMFDDANCTIPTPASDVSFRPTATTPVVKYIKVTDESGENSVVYTMTLKRYSDVKEINVAGIAAIEGATKESNNTYKMVVSPAADSYSFKPVAYIGTTLKVYNGKTLLTPDADGVYTVSNLGGIAQNFRIVAVAADGKATAEFNLNVTKKAGSATDLIAVEGATKTNSGFVLPLYYAIAADLDVTVSAGATYKIYSDYECKNLCAEDRIILPIDNSKSFAYVKVTSEDGKFSEVHTVTLLNQAGNKRAEVVVTATAGNASYTAVRTGYRELTVYLPKGVKTVTLNAKYDLIGSTAELSMFADPDHSVALNSALNLNKKITKAYVTSKNGTFNFDRYVPDSQTGPQIMTMYGIISESEWVVNVVSNQDVVKYRDASSIASWAKPFVDYLNNGNYKIFEGDAMQNFNGSRNITRNEISVIASSVMGLDVTKYSNVQLNFADTVADWALPYVKAAVSTGIISGAVVNGQNVFNGYANATREQVITIFVSMLAVQDGIGNVVEYYTAHKNDIDQHYVTYDFADDAKVSGWAAPYVHMAVAEYELISGAPVGDQMYLNPQNNITRAEVAKIVACMLGY